MASNKMVVFSFSLTCSARSLSVRSMSGTVLRCSAGLFFEVERARCNGWKAGMSGISCDHIMTLEQRAPPCQESTPPCPCTWAFRARERAARGMAFSARRHGVSRFGFACSAVLDPPAASVRPRPACGRETARPPAPLGSLPSAHVHRGVRYRITRIESGIHSPPRARTRCSRRGHSASVPCR